MEEGGGVRERREEKAGREWGENERASVEGGRIQCCSGREVRERGCIRRSLIRGKLMSVTSLVPLRNRLWFQCPSARASRARGCGGPAVWAATEEDQFRFSPQRPLLSPGAAAHQPVGAVGHGCGDRGQHFGASAPATAVFHLTLLS